MRKNINLLVSFILITTTLITINAQTKEKNLSIKERIDSYLSKGERNGFSGAVLIAQKGTIILNKGYGLASREKSIANTPNTVFSTGSVTKQFTATAILKLVELDKLKLTDSLELFFDHLPEDKKHITIHELLTHSAGFIDVIGNGDFHHIPTKEFFKTLFHTKLRYSPGTKYKYSNAGYSILARIIELVSKQSYESFLSTYLFTPAGMLQTGYLLPKWKENTLANGYYKGIKNLGTMVARFQRDQGVSWVLKGNGGIQSTQEDMYKWYLALKLNIILSKKSMNLLTKPYISEREGSNKSFYAYGWAIFNSDRNTKIITHNGSNGIFFHEFMWLPKEDTVIIFSTNAYAKEVEVLWKLEKMIFDQNYTPKPIQKSRNVFVLNFIENNSFKKVKELKDKLKQTYGDRFNDANVLNQIGYLALEKKELSDWAVPLFLMNTKLFPKNSNIWDSLGDGYKAIDDKENGIKAYKKALILDPTIEASKKSLKALGVKINDNATTFVKLSPETIQNYTGAYQLPSGHSIKVFEKNEELYIEFPGRTPMTLIPKTVVKFGIGNRSTTLSFNKNNSSKIVGFTINESGEQMIAKKMGIMK